MFSPLVLGLRPRPAGQHRPRLAPGAGLGSSETSAQSREEDSPAAEGTGLGPDLRRLTPPSWMSLPEVGAQAAPTGHSRSGVCTPAPHPWGPRTTRRSLNRKISRWCSPSFWGLFGSGTSKSRQ